MRIETASASSSKRRKLAPITAISRKRLAQRLSSLEPGERYQITSK
jgi:hypothetical protein